jgi:hypothetical protein
MVAISKTMRVCIDGRKKGSLHYIENDDATGNGINFYVST